MKREDFYIKTNDTSPHLEATLVDGDDVGIDLTNATVRFRMRAQAADSLSIDSRATIVTASEGLVRYSWSESETSEPGYFLGEFGVDFDGATGDAFNADETYPNDGYISIRISETL